MAAPAAAQAQTPEPLPPALLTLTVARAADLAPERRQLYADRYRNVPRPPRLMHHLLSPDFVHAANSAQLVDLITAEPVIAVKVLTAVNSPMFGLKSPVGSIGQAVTYLGLNTVRSVCLQHILSSVFSADSVERKRMLEATWKSSALASGLIQHLAQRLEFNDRGTLVSAVVLSFLGRLAIIATIPQEQLAAISARGLLERTLAEQAALGLSAAEIGRLLMSDWGLPA